MLTTKKIYAIQMWDNLPYPEGDSIGSIWDFKPDENYFANYFYDKELSKCSKKKRKFITDLVKGSSVYDKDYGYELKELEMIVRELK